MHLCARLKQSAGSHTLRLSTGTGGRRYASKEKLSGIGGVAESRFEQRTAQSYQQQLVSLHFPLS